MNNRIAAIKARYEEGRPIRRIDVKYLIDQLERAREEINELRDIYAALDDIRTGRTEPAEEAVDRWIALAELVEENERLKKENERLKAERMRFQERAGNWRLSRMDKLLPCPFCGGEASLDYDFNGIGVTYGIHCPKCHCAIIDTGTYSKDEAIAAWNRRAQPENKPLTNADHIRSMSDEELAEWLVDANMCERVCIEEDYCGCDVCVNRVTDWLKQPAKEE